jgi:glycosyl transferase, family 25
MDAIPFLQKQFDKIYVLSIARLNERHALLHQNLKGLQYQLFFGADKTEIDLTTETEKGNYNNEIYLKYNKEGDQMRLGAYCCAIGHKAIYEDMVTHNIEKALILEDDALLINNNLDMAFSIFKELPNNWELLYLGFEKNDQPNFRQKINKFWYQLFPNHALLKLKRKQFKKYYATPISNHIWQAGFHDCTHAYGITLAGAKKMIALQTPIAFKSDNLLSYGVTLNMLNAYIVKPKLFDQLSIHKNTAVQSLVTENQ